jgi:hypothetical protein
MARFGCRGCVEEGTFDYTDRHACPKCGSDNVQFALSIEELADDHPLIAELAENDPPQVDD